MELLKKKHWYALLQDENDLKANLKMAYKLNPQHLKPEGYQKMNLPLAVELFSESVSNAMKLLKDEPDCIELRDCDSTIIFIEKVNKLIKAMLSRTPADALKPVDDNASKKAIIDFDTFIRSWETIAKEKIEQLKQGEKNGDSVDVEKLKSYYIGHDKISDCQKHWKSIQDNFRKAVNLRTYKSGAAGGKRRPIKYERELEFLKPHLQRRQQTSNLDSSPEDTQTSDTLSLDNDSPRPSSQMSSYSQPKQNWGRASDILEKYLLSKESEDAVDIFFKTMATTVKKLPQQIQAEIKKEVFKIVNDAELKFYAKHDINPTPSFDESCSSIKISSTGYTVDNTEDTTYVPTRVARNTTPQLRVLHFYFKKVHQLNL